MKGKSLVYASPLFGGFVIEGEVNERPFINPLKYLKILVDI